MAVYKNNEGQSFRSTVDTDLKSLLKEYLRKSEVLEEKENYVLKQVEMLHSAVSSLQASSRRQSPDTLQSDNSNIYRIEEETRKIEEETRRIQEEIKQKIRSNRLLEEEVRQRKEELKLPTDDVYDVVMDPSMKKKDLGVVFFNEKLSNLKAMEKRLRKDSCEGEEEAKLKLKQLKDRLAILEWDSELDKMVLDSLNKLRECKGRM